MSTLAGDLRHAVRLLRRSPGFALGALLALALGVGANSAIFSVVNAVLLRPLPFPEPERLVFITREGDVSILDGVDWRAQSRSLGGIALFLRNWAFDLSGQGEPLRVNGSVVEPDYFRVLRMAPLLGRVLTAEDNRPGAPRVAVLSEGFWRRRFGGDPGVLGRSVVLSDSPTSVVGVMPRAFDFLGDRVDLWISVAAATPQFLGERGTNNFDAIGRLNAGYDVAQARAEMLAISRRLAAQYPDSNRRKLVEPLPLLEFMVGGVRRSLLVLLAAVGLVMLVGSANLAGLLLARSTARAEEFAVRASLGAGAGRLLRQLLAEGLLLALLGGGAGVLVAVWGRDALVALAPEGLPRLAEVPLDARVLVFGLALALASGLLMSLVPALGILRRDPAGQLRGAGRTTAAARRHRVLGAVVAVELALAFVLLVGSGLLLRSFARLQAVDLGFDAANLLTGDLVLPESRYGTREAQTRAFRGMVEALRDAPGVESAAYVITPPLSSRGGIGSPILFAEPPDAMPVEAPGARVRFVYGDYFATLRLPLVAGRGFTADDSPDAPPVAVVNERFAREFWPREGPIGRRISFRWTQDPRWLTIVGVVSDLKGISLTEPDFRTVYVPYVQRNTDWQRWGTLVLRTRSAPRGFVPALQAAVWGVDPALPVTEVASIEERRAGQSAQQRFNALALVLFAAVALLVALQGIYALLAWAVEERRPEIGVRMALGANPADVTALVLRRGLRAAGVGLLLGLALALALGRLTSSLLFEVPATDPATYAAAVAVVALATVASALLPARRAARVDPMAALRQE